MTRTDKMTKYTFYLSPLPKGPILSVETILSGQSEALVALLVR